MEASELAKSTLEKELLVLREQFHRQSVELEEEKLKLQVAIEAAAESAKGHSTQELQGKFHAPEDHQAATQKNHGLEPQALQDKVCPQGMEVSSAGSEPIARRETTSALRAESHAGRHDFPTGGKREGAAETAEQRC